MPKQPKGGAKIMVINHNISAMYASRIEGVNANNLQGSMERLSSGLRINRAADGASELSISEKMRSQIRGLNQASRNVSDAVSFVQTTEGHLQSTTDILQRIRELAVQASNGIYAEEDRMQIQVEVSQLVAEVDRIASQAQFNGMNMLTGRFATEGINFQVGANMDQSIRVNVAAADATSLGLKGTQEGGEMISVADQDSANMAIGTIDEALKMVNKQRADLGAVQNRMETAQKGIDIAAENLTASESRIRDVDVAEETVSYVRDQILTQSSLAMISQANSQSQNVLALLK